MTGGLIAKLFYDFLGNIGSLLLIIALWLVLIRSYFGFSYYKPIKNLYSKLEKKRADKKLVNENLITEQEKKDHTQSLLTKIEEQRKKDLPLDRPDENSDNELDQAKDQELEKEEDSTNNEEIETEVLNDVSKSEDLQTKEKTNDLEKIEVEEMVQEEEVDLDTVEKRNLPKKEFQLVLGDLLFQDLDSSPLCDAIELVTPGFENGNFSHIGLVVEIGDLFCF